MRKIAFINHALTVTGLLAILSGCGTTPAQVIVKTQHDIVAPEDALLINCDVEAPPAKKDYLADVGGTFDPNNEVAVLTAALKNSENREKLLSEFSAKQTANLIKCNARWKGLRTWKDQVVKQGTAPPVSTKE